MILAASPKIDPPVAANVVTGSGSAGVLCSVLGGLIPRSDMTDCISGVRELNNCCNAINLANSFFVGAAFRNCADESNGFIAYFNPPEVPEVEVPEVPVELADDVVGLLEVGIAVLKGAPVIGSIPVGASSGGLLAVITKLGIMFVPEFEPSTG